MAVECGTDVLSTGRAVSCVRVRVRPAQFSVGAGRVARLVSAELVGWPGDGGRRGCVGSWMRHCGPRPILPYRIDRRRVSAYFIVRRLEVSMYQYFFHCPACGERYLEWEEDDYCCVRCGTPLSRFVEDSRLTSVPPDACGGENVDRESNSAAGAGEHHR